MAPQALSQQERTYTVVRGDTLWDISQKFYDNPHLWPALWALNQDRMSNPHRLSVGDVLIIYPKAKLEEKMAEVEKPKEKEVAVAKEPEKPKSLYETGEPLETLFPKHFTYLANPEGAKDTGVNMIRVKKAVYEEAVVGIGPSGEDLKGQKKKIIETYAEAYQVGEIIGTEEQEQAGRGAGNFQGKSMLSTYDNVIVYFSKDMAKILDSAAHGEADPYFREYPIYTLSGDVKEPTDTKQRKSLGQMHQYRGTLTIVARVETSKVEASSRYLKKVIDRDPVFYVARITNAVEPIEVGDYIFYFKVVERNEQ